VTLEELHMAEFQVTDSGLLEVLSEAKITDFTADLLGEIDLVVPQEFYARSKDGTEVQCWAMAPRGAVPGKRYPVVLNVHGGPFTQYGNHLFDEFQLQSARGFGVLYCNPRGSSGYSEAWGRSIRWPECEEDPGSGWGGVDFEDVMACVEHALENFSWVDKDRLGVAGGSYGGYMTSWVIGHSSIFKAACCERACNNLLTMEHSADIAGFIKSYVGVSYLDDPSLYLRNSPVSYIKEIETPLLIVHSEEDLRCPINQAEELFVGLKLLGRSVEMVRFPGENHELSRSGSPKHRVERAKLFLGWFEDRLNQDKQTL
jgi:dipeptidyl aminopeptidase/acylaminoacyl peptidase